MRRQIIYLRHRTHDFVRATEETPLFSRFLCVCCVGWLCGGVGVILCRRCFAPHYTYTHAPCKWGCAPVTQNRDGEPFFELSIVLGSLVFGVRRTSLVFLCACVCGYCALCGIRKAHKINKITPFVCSCWFASGVTENNNDMDARAILTKKVALPPWRLDGERRKTDAQTCANVGRKARPIAVSVGSGGFGLSGVLYNFADSVTELCRHNSCVYGTYRNCDNVQSGETFCESQELLNISFVVSIKKNCTIQTLSCMKWPDAVVERLSIRSAF